MGGPIGQQFQLNADLLCSSHNICMTLWHYSRNIDVGGSLRDFDIVACIEVATVPEKEKKKRKRKAVC